MIILIAGATATLGRFPLHPNLGRLKVPRCGNSIEKIVASGSVWAADNDAFSNWDQERFWKMLTDISHASDLSRFWWVACPDVVGDAQATINRWFEWYPQIESLGLPAAFVGQDGLGSIADQVPWDAMDAFFIGGSTNWKLSAEAEGFAREAKSRGKLVHMGRVNTYRRIRHAMEIGCDSVDGRSFSAYPEIYIPKAIRWIRIESRQPVLFS